MTDLINRYGFRKMIEVPRLGKIPLLDIPMMSDKRWNELAAENAVRNFQRINGHPPVSAEEALRWQRDWVAEKEVLA